MKLQRASLLLAAVLLVTVLAACGTSGVTPPPPPVAPGLGMLPALGELPAPPAVELARSVASAIPLDLTTGTALNATAAPNSLQLASTASANSAGYFGMEPTYNAKRIPYLAPYSLTFTTDGAGEVWVAVSNYKKGRWEVLPAPFTAAGTHTEPITLTRDAGSPTGGFWFAFVSSRGQAPTISDVSLEYPDAPAVATDPVEYRQFITANDGTTRLATSVYLPYVETNPLIPDPPYPAVLVRTPYDKAQVDPALIGTGTGINVAVIVQYFRGRLGDSGDWPDSDGTEGLFDDHAGPAHADALDTVDWLESRLWYNGDLAVTGPSALGLAAYQSVPALGSRLKGFFAQISAADAAQWVMLENGCFGEYNVESFLTTNGYPAQLLTDVQQHYANSDAAFFAGYDYTARAGEVVAPGFHETGWWDVDVNESIRSWQSFNTAGGAGALGQQYLVIGPWTHAGLRGDSAGDLLFPNSGDINDPQVLPTGFDGIQFLIYSLSRNPFYTPPAVNHVCYYMVGPEGDTSGINNKWLTSPDWPPASLPTFMYLDKAGALGGLPGLLSTETFQSDPADPIGTVGGGLLPFGALQAGPLAANPLFLEDAGDFLWFSTGAQATDVTVAGDITLTLRVSVDSTTTAPSDCDIAAWLIDEDGGGNQLIVANGIVRLSDYLAKHGGGPFALDTPYNVTFSLGSRAYNFAAGHKLVLYIAGSNAPQYAVNPGNGDALYDGTNGVVQDIELTYGDVLGGQCQLLLPIRTP